MKKSRNITVLNLQETVEINNALVEEAVGLVMDEEALSGELNVVFADDDFVRDLNKKYLSKDRKTDVLAFGMDSGGMAGDVAVSAGVAAEQAAEYGHTTERELVLLAVHGALHLAGYRDGKPAERRLMEKRQKEILGRVMP